MYKALKSRENLHQEITATHAALVTAAETIVSEMAQDLAEDDPARHIRCFPEGYTWDQKITSTPASTSAPTAEPVPSVERNSLVILDDTPEADLQHAADLIREEREDGEGNPYTSGLLWMVKKYCEHDTPAEPGHEVYYGEEFRTKHRAREREEVDEGDGFPSKLRKPDNSG